MSNQESKADISRVLASIYGSMVILAGILLFLTSTGIALTTLLLTTDHQVRAFMLFWLVCWMLLVTGVELARNLYKSGMSSLTFLLFLLVNFVMVLMIQVVFADTLNTDAAGTAVGMVVAYLIGGAIYTLLIVLLMLREWRSRRS
ncbi:MAG: hypothetical protein EAX95_13715 [Candidatus Thorarchaeota archaeon]|nr:hypothetical protein [Candidatus Thorarchaeota archaeon]